VPRRSPRSANASWPDDVTGATHPATCIPCDIVPSIPAGVVALAKLPRLLTLPGRIQSQILLFRDAAPSRGPDLERVHSARAEHAWQSSVGTPHGSPHCAIDRGWEPTCRSACLRTAHLLGVPVHRELRLVIPLSATACQLPLRATVRQDRSPAAGFPPAEARRYTLRPRMIARKQVVCAQVCMNVGGDLTVLHRPGVV